MAEYMTTKEASEKWNITERRINVLCKEGRIPGAYKENKRWVIPMNAVKQADRSYKDIHYLYSFNKYNGVTSEHEKLLPYLTSNATFLFDYGKSLSASGNYEKSDSILKLGTRISSDPMFWNIMGNNSLALGRYREAEERYMHAFLMVPNRLYPLCLLTKLYYAEGDYERACKMAKMVMEFKPKVESTTTKELRNEIAVLITGIPDGL